MVEFLIQHWWIWFVGAIIFGCPGLVIYLSHRNRVEAQLIEPVSFIGCFVAVFYSLGIISAILSIISALLRIFVWYVKA